MKERLLSLYKKHKDVIPYLIFGVLTTAVNVVSYALLTRVVHLSTIVSVIVAWFLAVLFAYLTNRKWVFKSKAKTRKEIAREVVSFFSCRLATGVLDWLIMLVFVDGLHFNDIIIKIIANIIVIVLNYVASKMVIFKSSAKNVPLNVRLSSVLKWSVYGLLSGLLLIIFGIVLTFPGDKYARKIEFLLPNIVLLIISAAFFVGLALFVKRTKLKIFKRRDYTVINVLSVILFCALIYITLNTCFYPGWDAGGVLGHARTMSFGQEASFNHYYSLWPNQQLLLMIDAVFLRLSRAIGIVSNDGDLMGLVALQCLLMVIAGNLIYRILYKKTKSKQCAFVGWIIFLLLIGFSAWVNVPYTDSLAICFPVFIYYCYLKKEESGKHKAWWWALIGALSYLGYKTKPTVLIMLIAIIAGEFVFGIAKREKGRMAQMAKGGAALLASVIISSQVFAFAFRLTGIESNSDYNVGALHLVMMGLNKDTCGAWNSKDVTFSYGFGDDREGRKKAQIEEIKKRLGDFGVSGLLEFETNKALSIFNDGTFAWGHEGNFYAETYPLKNTKAGPFLRDLFYHTGKKNKILATVQQAVWLFVLGLCALAVFLKKNKNMTILVISLIGIILFNFIFEMRARYLLVFVPVFIVVATMVLWQLLDRKKRKKIARRKAQS